MITRITGTVAEIRDRAIVLETGGIGYLINTPFPFVEIGSTLTLHTHLVIRDDSHDLYGFVSAPERDLFAILIGVSGVGPKTALQMLTLYPLPQLVGLIQGGSAKDLSLVPGIGKKTAEKVVIDLKDKLALFTGIAEHSANHDLIEALLSLGYRDHQIRNILSDIDENLPLERQITQALQLLQK